MKILFLHGWQSVPGGVKPTFLKDHGHEVINPALPHEDFAEAVRMASSSETTEDFLHVNSIKGYLDEDDARWAGRYDAGWTIQCREALRSACAAILGRPEWADRVREQLGSEDDLTFAHADQAAKSLGIDTWDIHWRRLQEKPTDPGRWYHVIALCDGERIGKVIEFAEASIDLAAIATGAGD
ncbi:MAG TPA: hypothetical protein VH592_01595 [Gemmataceae bacterium]|jgi:hypothetical protein